VVSAEKANDKVSRPGGHERIARVNIRGPKGHESIAQALAWVYISNGTALKGRQKIVLHDGAVRLATIGGFRFISSLQG
jgi:hypothetical protein